nr:MAG TPA: hypothetical protein [Caudoviricetes sp.]
MCLLDYKLSSVAQRTDLFSFTLLNKMNYSN